MLYAVVDIETTGSFAAANGITEIAIVIHDGKKVLHFYETLVNPHIPIPYFIQRLTGINNAMVANAPSFSEIAGQVHELLQDKVFVAHNVNFDYSFVRHHLQDAGYKLDTKKLCTVRLARKVLPGLNGYSLSKLTARLGINHANHHRAGGDALATADLLAIITQNDTEGAIAAMLKGRNSEQYMPPHLPVAELEGLPSGTGVYYFYNAAGKAIYIGKARNIRKRVRNHFSNNKVNRQKQDFLKETHHISYKECGTELMAHILESAEIRKLWPVHNRSQKGYLAQYGLFVYEDMQGFMRFAVEKIRRSLKPLYTFNTVTEGHFMLRQLIEDIGLCTRLCNISSAAECSCKDQAHTPEEYNKKAAQAIEQIRTMLPTFALIDKGIDDNEYSCILMKNGNIFGMGYITDRAEQLKSITALESSIEPVQDNDYIRNLVLRHATEYPEKCVTFY
ncbi:exonuclease domain-containing protein [Nemorincola caseinilytica]|uniref:Exonuclease domain-containing protein n=1 Tax=Nemorincola caseinilytica TaxID=2054315 RepID=A0ABP8NNF2_9BACT